MSDLSSWTPSLSIKIDPQPYLAKYPACEGPRQHDPIRVIIELPHPDDVELWLNAIGAEAVSVFGHDRSGYLSRCYRYRLHETQRHLESATRARTRGALYCARATKPILGALRCLAEVASQAERLERHHRAVRKERSKKGGVLL